MLSDSSGSCLNRCRHQRQMPAKMLREGSELAKTLLLQTLLDIHQSKPQRVQKKEHVELESLSKIDDTEVFVTKK